MRSAAAPRTRSGRRRPRTSPGGRRSSASKTIGASYGDAFLAALAVGDVRKEDIRNWNPVASEITPNPSETYRRQNEVFRGIYERTKDLMNKLDAPG